MEKEIKMRLPAELHERLKERAGSQYVSMSAYIRQLIANDLKATEQKEQA